MEKIIGPINSKDELKKTVRHVQDVVWKEFNKGFKNGTLEQTVEMFGFILKTDFNQGDCIEHGREKILVIGSVAMKKETIAKVCEEFSIRADKVDFFCYKEVSKLFPGKLRFSNKYTDILIGPVPHSIKGLPEGEFINQLEKRKKEFPPFLVNRGLGGRIKPITKNDFVSFLKESEYLKKYSSNN